MIDLILAHREWLIAALTLGLAATAVGHVVINKRDVRAAIGWAGLVITVPLFDALCYFLFGVNRIQGRATTLRSGLKSYRSSAERSPPEYDLPSQLGRLSKLIGDIVDDPLCDGNRIASNR